MKIFSRKLAILIFFLLFGCANPTAEPTIEPTTEQTTKPAIYEFCTELGCSSETGVFIYGQMPRNYTIEFSDLEKSRVSITCVIENFDSTKTIMASTILKDPHFSDLWLDQEVPNFKACDNNDGYYKIYYQEIGVPISIIKQCGEPPNYDFLHYSYCAYNDIRIDDTPPGVYLNKVGNGAVLYGFAPELLEVNFLSGLIKKSEIFHPSYEIFQPNGPRCEPICKYSDIVINIP